MQITFDNVSLNSYPYFVRDMDDGDTPGRDVFAYGLARKRGSVIINTQFTPKKIKISGKIKGTSKANLETNIDSFKELLSRENKNLDIEYAGGTRRYKATMTALRIPRTHYQITSAKYEVEFLVPEAVGQSISNTNHSVDAITNASETGSISVVGSASPEPTITLTFSSASGISQVDITINGNKITIEQSISASDVLIIDTENLRVLLNGVEKDYLGRFPDFVVGSNSYQIDITSTSHEYDLDIDYNPKYL